MGTNEKRCNECEWEFYECFIDEFTICEETKKPAECCPECGSTDWEYKLIGTKY